MNPFTYIDEIEEKKHLILVYDDIKKGREIEYYFIKRGLENREKCIYFTHDSPYIIEQDMQKYGIEVANNKKKSMLYVHPMPNLTAGPSDILDNLFNLLKQIGVDRKTPFRIVGRAISDIGFEEAIEVQLYLEKSTCGIFNNLNCSILCTYDLSQIKANNRWFDWLDKLESCHHASLITTFDKNLVRINTNA